MLELQHGPDTRRLPEVKPVHSTVSAELAGRLLDSCGFRFRGFRERPDIARLPPPGRLSAAAPRQNAGPSSARFWHLSGTGVSPVLRRETGQNACAGVRHWRDASAAATHKSSCDEVARLAEDGPRFAQLYNTGGWCLPRASLAYATLSSSTRQRRDQPSRRLGVVGLVLGVDPSEDLVLVGGARIVTPACHE